MKALSLLDLGKQWDIEWWEADTRPVSVSSLRPNVLVIQQLVARKELWPVKRGRKPASGAVEVPNAAAADAWDSVSAFATADVPDSEAEAVDAEDEGLGEDSMQAEAQDLWERVEEVLDEAGLVEVGTGVMDLFGTGAGPIDNPDGTDEADGMEAEAFIMALPGGSALASHDRRRSSGEAEEPAALHGLL